MLAQIIKNAFWLTIGEIIGRALRITLIVYAARVLGTAEWGIASYTVSWAVLFTIATDIGLGAVLTRHLIHEPAHSNRYLRAACAIKCSLLIVSGIIMVLILPKIGMMPLSPLLITLLFGLVFFDTLRLIPSAVNKARETMHHETVIAIITQSAILAIGVSMLSILPSAEGLILAYVMGSAIGTIYAVFTVKKYIPQLFTPFPLRLARELIRDALPIAAIGLLGSIMLNTDIIMIGWFKGAADVGLYSAAQKIIFTLYVIPTLIASATFPALARLTDQNRAFTGMFEKTLTSIFMLAAPLTVGGIIIAPEIINLVYGAVYIPATASFIILLLTIPLVYATTLIVNALLAHNAQKKCITYAVIGACGNTLGNSILIPLWGIEGAALATVITQAISTIFIWRALQKIHSFTIGKKLIKTTAAAAGMGIIAYGAHLLRTPVLALIPLAGISYGTLLYILKEPLLAALLYRKNI